MDKICTNSLEILEGDLCKHMDLGSFKWDNSYIIQKLWNKMNLGSLEWKYDAF